METFRIVDLGCKVNRYDGEVVRGSLRRLGLREAGPDEHDADVVVLNACAVTDRAVAKGRRTLRRLRRRHPGARVVVTGCATAPDLASYRAVEPSLLALTADRRERLGEALALFLEQPRPIAAAAPPLSFEPPRFQGRTRAFVKVEDGCDARCSFCVIPTTRGPARSRPAVEIEREVRALARRGVPEIVLCGVHLGHYGRDTGDDLVALVARLSRLDGAFRLRLSSLEVTEVGDRLARLVATEERLVPHLHVPLQSADDGVLRAMRRPYTAQRFRARIEEVRAHVPDLALTTDVMVGFPGESEAAFERTERFLEELGFAALHVFPFSPRRGTEASTLPGRVDVRRVRQRTARLLRLDRRLRERFDAHHVGRVCVVVVETGGERAVGLCEHYRRVSLPPGPEPGESVRCRITGRAAGVLRGEALS